MSSCHRPRIYRSIDGCCICGAKSSSSRFTSSCRYEQHFEQCFGLDVGEQRTGDICNACVLLVKRFRKLPFGSTRCWSHVKDARTGPGLKSINKLKCKKTGALSKTLLMTSASAQITASKRNAANMKLEFVHDGLDDDAAMSDADQYSECSSGSKDDVLEHKNEFIDSKYWKRFAVCCGVIYRGAYGECLLDAACYRPCPAHSSLDQDLGGKVNKKILTNDSKPLSVDSGNDESSSLDELTDADSCGTDVGATTVDMAIDLSVRSPGHDVMQRPVLPSTIRLLAVNEI